MKWSIVIVIAVVGILFLQSAISNERAVTKEQLGEMLFNDRILSRDRTISCASCHRPEYGFADTGAVSMGVDNRRGVRNSPSVMNLRLLPSFFWDGRAATLEAQALEPIINPVEMDLPLDEAIRRLNESNTYRDYFQQVFQQLPTLENIAIAIAAFERTLETGNSPFDRWRVMDDSTQVNSAARRGFTLFNGKGKCVKCHFGSDLTTNEFRNIGLFDGRSLNDSGRAVVTHRAEDLGKFKVPGLRNIAITAPYMHHGKLKTLKEVIEFYNDPRKKVPRAMNIDSVLSKPLNLTKNEIRDLEEFLKSLTDDRFETSRLPSHRQSFNKLRITVKK